MPGSVSSAVHSVPSRATVSVTCGGDTSDGVAVGAAARTAGTGIVCEIRIGGGGDGGLGGGVCRKRAMHDTASFGISAMARAKVTREASRARAALSGPRLGAC